MTGMFILFCGFNPQTHRYDCARSCRFAYHKPMRFCLYVCTPLVWFFDKAGEHDLPSFQTAEMVRGGGITSDDIYAVVEAGALAACYVNRNTS
ncbi:hypothetical protein ACLK19_28510 [Escherichia coli]